MTREYKQFKFGKCPVCGAKKALVFEGEWNLKKIVPDKYGFRCKYCRLGFVSDGREASKYVKGIGYQTKLTLLERTN